MDTTIMGLYRDYRLGIYRDNEKEKGNYYIGFRVYARNAKDGAIFPNNRKPTKTKWVRKWARSVYHCTSWLVGTRVSIFPEARNSIPMA